MDKEKKKTPNNTSTPYDDVFRTLLNDCRQLILPVINEVFKEHYIGNEIIEFSPNEHFLNQQGGNEDKRVTDSVFRIIAKSDKYADNVSDGMEKPEKKYHLECESTPGNKVLIRIFEYDAQIALDDGKSLEGRELLVSFPHSAVLFLRSSTNTPDVMKITIKTPGGNVSYDVPTLKMADYTVEDIFEKKLYFLIPFLIFNHEKGFKEIDRDNEKIEELKAGYGNIKRKLEELIAEDSEKGEETLVIDEYVMRTIIEMSKKVIEHAAVKYKNIQKGVGEVMGGQVLDYEAKRIRNSGIIIGEERGIIIGEERGIIIGEERGIIIGEKRGIRIGKERGKILGAIDIYKEEFGYGDNKVIEKIMERFGLSKNEAEEYIVLSRETDE